MIKLSLNTTVLVLLFTFLLKTNIAIGQRNFRLIEPDHESRYGKSAYSNPPFLYFDDTLFYYRIWDSEYDGHEDAVSDAFSSWSNSTQVEISFDYAGDIDIGSWYDSYRDDEIINPGLAVVSNNNDVIDEYNSLEISGEDLKK